MSKPLPLPPSPYHNRDLMPAYLMSAHRPDTRTCVFVITYSMTSPPLQVYHGSLEWGSGDIKTTGGYFHMANVFFRQNKMDIADSLYNQVGLCKNCPAADQDALKFFF